MRTRIDVEWVDHVLVVPCRVRVGVRGVVHGFVRCGGKRFWAWGAFYTVFFLPVSPLAKQVNVEVVAVGLGGRVRVTRAQPIVTRIVWPDPSLARRAPRPPSAPRLAIATPRVMGLTAAEIMRRSS